MIINQNATCIAPSGKKYASGKVVTSLSSQYKLFRQYNGSNANMNYVEVAEKLGFTPSLIIIKKAINEERNYLVMYKIEGWTTSRNTIVQVDGNAYYTTGGDLKVDENGFILPWTNGNQEVEWEAYE